MIYYQDNKPRSERAADVVARLNRFPIAHRGRYGADDFVDCLGAMLAAHLLFGPPLDYDQSPFNIPYTLYWFRASPGRLINGMRDLGWSNVTHVQEMDVFMLATVTTLGDHPAVYVGNGEIIHAGARSRGVVVESVSAINSSIKAILRPKGVPAWHAPSP